MNDGCLLCKNSNNCVSSEILFEEEIQDFPRGRNCELRFLLSMQEFKIGKDAFKSKAETSQKKLQQHLEISQQELGEKLKRRRKNTSVHQ